MPEIHYGTYQYQGATKAKMREFDAAVSKHGGKFISDSDFQVPAHRAKEFHKSLKESGFNHGYHYHMHKNSEPSQHSEQPDPTEQSQAALLRYGEVVLAPPIPLRDGVGQFAEGGEHSLWKYNKTTGYWKHQRTVSHDTKADWLKVFQKDEPNEHFHVSKHKPSHNPTVKS